MARGREPDHRSLDFNNRRERDRSPIRDIGVMTSDPDTATSRIFVGSLTPNITRPMLENHFSRWGNIVGVTLTKNKFGFVQFGKETEAQACLAAGPFTILNGERLDVKPARLGPGQSAPPPPAPGLGNNLKPGPSGYGGNGRGGTMWESRDNYGGGGRDHLPPPRDDRYYDPYYSDSKTRESEEHRYDDYYRDYYDNPRGGSSESSTYYRSEVDSRLPPTRSYESSYAYPSASEPLDPLDPMRPNDVEIVVPNKAQRGFAESIEAQLRRMNLLVDLLFPPPDITPTRVLNDLSDRHCLYAIFATTENEKHSSLTLNILHGEPQEHRNMPVEDALRLIQRNFEDYVKQTRMRNMRQVVPRDIRNLLLDLLEMRSLSMGDLDKLIKYLRERQNALVDDQIEQKREIAAETQSSLVAGSMTVTYPGYNYIASTVPGTVTDTSSASVVAAAAAAAAVAAAPQGIIQAGAGAPPAVAQQPASLNIVSSSNAAAAIAAYPATAYTTTGMLGAYGVTPQSQAPHQIMTAPPPVVPGPAQPPPPQSKQVDLQERILNLMKSQSGLSQGVASGVPGPPTGVPPPSVVQDARMVQQHHQQPNQHSLWMQQGAPPPPDNADKVQGSQHAYNPWSQ